MDALVNDLAATLASSADRAAKVAHRSYNRDSSVNAGPDVLGIPLACTRSIGENETLLRSNFRTHILQDLVRLVNGLMHLARVVQTGG